MIRGLYDAGAALQIASLHQELLSENLANATTSGYRRHGISFEQQLQEQRGAVAAPVYHTSFNPGPMLQTGNPLDVAVSGDGFFVLEGPNGPVYTRNGSFEMNAQGELLTRSGMRVSGQGGTINIPPDAGAVVINAEGVILADGAEVGRLQLARFDNPQALERVGPTLFQGPAAQEPDPENVRVTQGFREGANVEAVQEMVSMMIGMRQYEAAERALRAIGESIALNTRPQT